MNMPHIERQNIELFSSKNMERLSKKFSFMYFDFEDSQVGLLSKYLGLLRDEKNGNWLQRYLGELLHIKA